MLTLSFFVFIHLGCQQPDSVKETLGEPIADSTQDASETFSTIDLAERLATENTVLFPTEYLPFDWMQTVWAYGIHRLHHATADPQWQDYYERWIIDSVEDFTADTPHRFHSSDSLSPALMAATLILENPALEEQIQPIIDEADRYLDTAPVLSNGAIAHWGPENPWGFPSDQVWIDSQFMFGLYLLRRYEYTKEEEYLHRFMEQYLLFSDLCRNTENQLYYHAFDDATATTIPSQSVFWARGNAWVLIAAAEALHVIPTDHAYNAQLATLFLTHATAVKDHQTDKGGWLTILNDPYQDDDNYQETSATALITYAFVRGVRSTVLPTDEWTPTIQNAVDALNKEVSEDEERLLIEGTSVGTNPGDYDYYLSVGQVDNHILGIGSLIMLYAELHGLPY